VKNGHLQLALREVRGTFWSLRGIGAFAGVAVILAIMAPFGTDIVENAVLRFCYWFVVVFLTASAGAIVTDVTRAALARFGDILASIAGAFATGVAVCVIVFGLNFAVFGNLPVWADSFGVFATIFAISLVISGIFALFSAAPLKADPSPILDRLPLEARGALMSLSAEDHYVRVRTNVREELILMRLADAISEVGGVDGLQVHRSHWVARDAIAKARREGERAVLTLTDGTEIPASRTYIPELKAQRILA